MSKKRKIILKRLKEKDLIHNKTYHQRLKELMRENKNTKKEVKKFVRSLSDNEIEKIRWFLIVNEIS